MQKGVLSQGWFVTCGGNGCANKEAVEGSVGSVESRLTKARWNKTAVLGWLCPECSKKNSQYIVRW